MRARRAIIQTLLSRQLGLVIRSASLVTLARLLSPEDFGVFATATAFIAIARAISDFGLSAYLIQQKELDRSMIKAAVGLSVLLSCTIVGGMSAGLYFLPEAYLSGEMRLALWFLALSLLAQPLLLAVDTALKRDLEFSLISALSVVRIIAQTAGTIVLAKLGFGASALAGGVLIETVIATAILLGAAGKGRFVAPLFTGWMSLFHFGLRYSASNFLGNLGSALSILSISRFLGVEFLGLYNRSDTVVSLLDKTLLEGIAPVMLPAISKSLREGKSPKGLYLKKVSYLSVLCWPTFAMIALLAAPLVKLLLGGQWDAAVPIVQILAIMGLFLPFTKMSMKLFVALDMNTEYLRLQAIHQGLRIAMVAGGAMISLEMACLGVALSPGVKALLVSGPMKRVTGYKAPEMLTILGASFGVTVTTVIGPALWLMFYSGPALPLVINLMIAGGLAGAGWLGGAAAFRHPLLLEVVKVVKKKLK